MISLPPATEALPPIEQPGLAGSWKFDVCQLPATTWLATSARAANS